METVIFLVPLLVILIVSVMLHEVAHGLTALKFGDTTAKDAGRITLNPIKHIDLMGTILLPGFLIFLNVVTGGIGFVVGWAKPIPINPRRFSSMRAGHFFVTIAGPAANLIIALIAGLMVRQFGQEMAPESFPLPLLVSIVWINALLGIINLIPIPPLDGFGALSALLGISWERREQISRFSLFFMFVFFFSVMMIPEARLMLFKTIYAVSALIMGAPIPNLP